MSIDEKRGPEEVFENFRRDLIGAQRRPSAVKGDSAAALKNIFDEFCTVICKHLKVDHVSIVLKHYDKYEPAGTAPDGGDTTSATRPGGKYQTEIERLAAPYRHYREDGKVISHNKGLLKLFAHHSKAWDSIKGEHTYVDAAYGITKEIIQNDFARVRDAFHIRSTRGWALAGSRDPDLWPGNRWKEVFKNYFGVPIRAVLDGEPLGILKVENKQFPGEGSCDNDRRFFPKQLRSLNVGNAGKLTDCILKLLGENVDAKGIHYSNRDAYDFSLLALVALKEELAGETEPLERVLQAAKNKPRKVTFDLDINPDKETSEGSLLGEKCPIPEAFVKADSIYQHWRSIFESDDNENGENYRFKKDKHKDVHLIAVEYLRPKKEKEKNEAKVNADRATYIRQLLSRAIPTPCFTDKDSQMLSWAALVCGLLIQRELSSYAGSKNPPIPLTVEDFERIPISSFGFVTELVDRYQDTRRLLRRLKHVVSDEVLDDDFVPSVTTTARVKNIRSHLQRIGERYEAFYKGAQLTWLYLLSRSLAKRKRGRRETDTKFLLELRNLRKKIDKNFRPNITLPKVCKLDAYFTSPPTNPDQFTEKQLTRNLLAYEQLVDRNEDDSWCIKNDRGLAHWVLRRFEPYCIYAISLYLQLVQTKEYRAFYTRVFSLRQKLSKAGNERSPVLIELHDDVWRRLMRYVAAHSTEDFRQAFDLSEADDELTLNVMNIYKRVRHLFHTLKHERRIPHLEWMLGRFDFVGIRFNTLYRNQVFSLYEDTWRRGDWRREKQKAPLKWLNLKSSVHKGEQGYYAHQIAAMVDPEDFTGEEAPRFSNFLRELGAVQKACGSFNGQYEEQVKDRLEYSDSYKVWFCNAAEALRNGRVKKANRDFGCYLGSGLVNCIIENGEPSDKTSDPYKTTRTLLKNLYTSEPESVTAKDIEDLYNSPSVLRGTGTENSRHAYLSAEKQYFLDILEADSSCENRKTPLFYVLQETKDKFMKTLSNPDLWKVRADQNEYLFPNDLDKSRGSDEILHRLLNYSLLVNPSEQVKNGNPDPTWAFYYLRSLIPVEIQFRTHLADTMAEHYHDPVYKNPRIDQAGMPVDRMVKVGRQLNELDCEMEVNYSELMAEMLNDPGQSENNDTEQSDA